MQNEFIKLTNHFYQIKDTNNKQQYADLIKQLQQFIDKYRDLTEVAEQATLAQALEFQLVLCILSEEQEQAAAIEKVLDEEFYGIHKIGKKLDKKFNATAGYLNLSPNLLDTNRLKQLAIKQQGTTKPKLLGWLLKAIGFTLLGITAWLFTLKWLWIPLVLGIIGVFFTTIGTQVTNLVNRFFSTIAFNAGSIIPGIITGVDKENYQAVFIAPLMTTEGQVARWGIKRITFKKAAGYFIEGEQLAAVCLFSQAKNGYYPDFMPTPVCCGYSYELIAYKAKSLITNENWQKLSQAIIKYKNNINNSLLTLDE